MCRIRLVGEFVCGGNNFVFNALMYFEPVQRSENMVKITGPGRCNNSISENSLDMLKAT